jgi:hypothetical protein
MIALGQPCGMSTSKTVLGSRRRETASESVTEEQHLAEKEMHSQRPLKKKCMAYGVTFNDYIRVRTVHHGGEDAVKSRNLDSGNHITAGILHDESCDGIPGTYYDEDFLVNNMDGPDLIASLTTDLLANVVKGRVRGLESMLTFLRDLLKAHCWQRPAKNDNGETCMNYFSYDRYDSKRRAMARMTEAAIFGSMRCRIQTLISRIEQDSFVMLLPSQIRCSSAHLRILQRVHSGLLQGIEIIQKAEEWRVGIGGREGIVEENRNIDEKTQDCVLSIASWAVRHVVTTKGNDAAFVNVIDVLSDSHADSSTAVKTGDGIGGI